MKKSISFFLAIAMLLSIVPQIAMATENNLCTDYSNVTLGEIQDIFHDYLENEGMQFSLGSDAYYSYIVDQLLNRTDTSLMEHENYDLIHSYMVEYKLAYEDYLLCMDSLEDECCDSDVLTVISNTSLCVKYQDDAGKVTFSISEEFLNQTIGEIACSNQANILVAENAVMSSTPYTYSGSDAATYAKLYANNYNTEYPSYSADCTNYVSQCVYAGGIAMDGSNSAAGTYESTDDWYCVYINSVLWIKRYAVTTSWVRVSDFSTFMGTIAGKSTHETIDSLYSACEIGDVVQLADKITGSAYHSIIISEKDSTSAYYCGHSNDRNNVDIEGALDESNDNFILFDFTR